MGFALYLKYFTYITLFFSILLLWIPDKINYKPWKGFFFFSLIVSCFFSGITNLISMLVVLLLYYLVNTYQSSNSTPKYLLWTLVWILCCALQAHLIPGFNNLLVLNAVQFTPDAKPYTMYLNFDKAVVGLIILGTTLKLVNSWQEWKILFKQIMYELPIIVPAIILIIILSIIFNYIKFELKFPQLLWIWGINNLFFTCIAEEALWRGFVQESLTKFKYQYSEYIALLISAIFFGLAHFPGGGKYVLLATIAGVLYGWVYKVTKRIEASILTHFTLNLVHILFFTYPALKLFYKALTVCG